MQPVEDPGLHRPLGETLAMFQAAASSLARVEPRASLSRAPDTDAPLLRVPAANGHFRSIRRKAPCRPCDSPLGQMARTVPKTRPQANHGRGSCPFLLKRVSSLQQAPHNGTALIALKTKDNVNHQRGGETLEIPPYQWPFGACDGIFRCWLGWPGHDIGRSFEGGS